MQFTRFLALLACLGSGASIPLATMADGQKAAPMTLAQSYHTSTRNPVHLAKMTAEDLTASRAALWALTSQGETFRCDAAGVVAPCADTVKLDQAQ